jgi:hypothetical protein
MKESFNPVASQFKKEITQETPVESKQPSILESMDNQIALYRKLDDVYGHRPELDSFVGAMADKKYAAEYSKESIERDKAYIDKTRRQIEEANSSFGRELLDRKEGGFALSEMAQAMVIDRINKNWFPGFKAIMTSDFDDLRVGIDAVMKHENGGYLGTAFDFTVASNEKVIHDKLSKEWDNHISQGKISTVKYFEDPDTHTKGRLLVPKFIIGASKKDVESLAQAYLSNDQQTLDSHPLKRLIFEQIRCQLDTALLYYDKHQDDSRFDFAKQKYEVLEKIFNRLKSDIEADPKVNGLEYHEYSKNSVALQAMKSFQIIAEHR